MILSKWLTIWISTLVRIAGSNGSQMTLVIVGFFFYGLMYFRFYFIWLLYDISLAPSLQQILRNRLEKILPQILGFQGTPICSQRIIPNVLFFDNNYFDWKVILYRSSKFTRQHCQLIHWLSSLITVSSSRARIVRILLLAVFRINLFRNQSFTHQVQGVFQTLLCYLYLVTIFSVR